MWHEVEPHPALADAPVGVHFDGLGQVLARVALDSLALAVRLEPVVGDAAEDLFRIVRPGLLEVRVEEPGLLVLVVARGVV